MLWTVRSPLRLAVQPANCSRLVGRRRRMICHRAMSLSSVQYKWGRWLNVVGECCRWPSCNRWPGMEAPNCSMLWTPVWLSWTRHGVAPAASVIHVKQVWYVHIVLCEWPASQRHSEQTAVVAEDCQWCHAVLRCSSPDDWQCTPRPAS